MKKETSSTPSTPKSKKETTLKDNLTASLKRGKVIPEKRT
jgi:hypothetical protein